jgi:CubicO group peptidase (beta-lactamase class C family)
MLKQHYIVSLDQKITEFFPEYNGINSDPRINLLTIGHMLTFMAGLDNDEDEALGETDMIRYYLSREFIAEPGEQFKYATPASHVLSAIISKKTGMNARDFASVRLFQKLGITGYKWYSDAQGYTYGGHNSFFCPRDMLKIGYLYLNRGIWDGDTIVDPGYVETSTVAHSDGGSPHNEKYGYNWWITRNNDYDAYFAGGYGGQFIYVVPDLQLVVAITCNTDKHREDARFLINSHVVPAILNTSAVSDDKGIESGVRLFPNPATGGISIRFGTTVETSVSVFIADLSGRKIVSLIDDKIFKAGEHIFTSRFDLPPGCYITEVIIGSNKRHAKWFVSH